MQKITISVVTLGSLKHHIDLNYIKNWDSKIFSVINIKSIGHLQNSQCDDWSYSREQLSDILKADESSDITIGLTNAQIEKNYYMHRLENNVAIFSLYEMDDIVLSGNYTLENYIIRNIYEIVAFYVTYNKLVPSDIYSWAHDDTRGCLFDMNANGTDIIYSMHKPILCEDCKAKILSKQIDSDFIPLLDGELKKIKKSNYVIIREWVKKHPVYALGLTAASGLILNILSNIIYDAIK